MNISKKVFALVLVVTILSSVLISQGISFAFPSRLPSVLDVKVQPENAKVYPHGTQEFYASVLNGTGPFTYEWSYQLVFEGGETTNKTLFGTDMQTVNFLLEEACAEVIISVKVSNGFGDYGFDMVTAVDPSAFTISSGIYPGAPSYTIYGISGTYYAKDQYGLTEFSGLDATTVITSALDGLTPARTWQETIQLKGTFTLTTSSIDTFGKVAFVVPDQTIIDLTQCYLVATASSDYNMLVLIQGDNVNVIGGDIDGNKNSQTAWSSGYSALIWAVGRNININGVTIHDSRGWGIEFYDITLNNLNTQNTVANCIIEDNKFEGIMNIDSNDSLFSHNIFRNNHVNTVGGGFNADIETEVGNCTITQNSFYLVYGFGINVGRNGGLGVKSGVISENKFYADNSSYPIQAGIQLGSYDGVAVGWTVHSNLIIGAQYGILGQMSHCILSKNIISNCPPSIGGLESAGIWIDASSIGHCNFNILSNNQIFDDQTISTTKYGIVATYSSGGSETLNYNRYDGNTVTNTTVNGLLLLGTNNYIHSCLNSTAGWTD